MTDDMTDAEMLRRMKAMTPEQIVQRFREVLRHKRRLLGAVGGRARRGSAKVRAACRKVARERYRADLERLERERTD